MKSKIIVGTRGSKLALWQAGHIADRLRQLNPGLTVELQRIVTTGDKILDVPLAQIGGKALFTKELELAMLAGEIDLAVHSLKDMPTELPQGLTLAATTERLDPYDAFISCKVRSLRDLPQGATMGTSSLRRKCQILKSRPDLNIIDLRGNVGTRLSKLDDGQYDAIILASAGLKRLELSERIRHTLDPELSLPAVGQGALGLECREGDTDVLNLILPLMHDETNVCVRAERAFNAYLEGGCQVPIAGFATLRQGEVHMEGRVGSLDGLTLLKAEQSGQPEQAEETGIALAKQLLALGAGELLKALH